MPIVRLHNGIPPKAVDAQLERECKLLRGHGDDTAIQLVGLHDLPVADVRPALTALVIAVVVVWLITCSNVASLLLARVAARRSEIAIRSALGAGRRRILSQFLTESLLLSFAGALGGLGLAADHASHIPALAREDVASFTKYPFELGGVGEPGARYAADGHGVWHSPCHCCFSNGNAGLINGGRKTMGDRSQSRLRSLLLIGEVALSIALLIGAGLMMRSMYALHHVSLGFRTDHLLLTSLTAPGDLYQGQNIASVAWKPILESARRLPGVQMAALSTVMPIEHPVELQTIVYATGRTNGDVSATVRAATPELAQALGIPMHSGRFFTDNDTAANSPVMVVNRGFVDRHLGEGDALGKQIRFGRIPQVVTICRCDRGCASGVVVPSQPEFYLCLSQLRPDHPMYRALLGRFMQLAIRTESSSGLVIPELRRSIQEENAHIAIGKTTTMAEAIEDSLGGQRLAAGVIGVFGGLALLITIFGIYGLMSYLVAQRTQEIRIRMALGADRSTVVRMVMIKTLVLMGTGITMGLGLAFWSHRLLHGFVYGVSQTGPWTMLVVPIGLLTCGIAATIAPARHARRSIQFRR